MLIWILYIYYQAISKCNKCRHGGTGHKNEYFNNLLVLWINRSNSHNEGKAGNEGSSELDSLKIDELTL